ncbi:hypothetical protein Francci3_4256 [Frankia casuarinae]|uniref:Uncharacterized protein n=1 Tax=Frankia casuarinae (strain DSM 45818 / CECT 9043 / HFP020203 / CcI3) TaxID=106370 RepID=Q2J540_FRACC|nr:hypothetical protein Francci3_4256 [Frankia casuarinae]
MGDDPADVGCTLSAGRMANPRRGPARGPARAPAHPIHPTGPAAAHRTHRDTSLCNGHLVMKMGYRHGTDGARRVARQVVTPPTP